MTSVFISYRRRSSAMLAQLIARELQARGIQTFMDTRQMDGGGPFPARLLRAIQDQDVFVCLVADSTFESDWMRREIAHAHTLNKIMIPVFQESWDNLTPKPAPPDEHVRALLQYDGVQVLDERNVYVDSAMDDLAAMIRRSAVPRARRNARSVWAVGVVIAVLGIAAVILALSLLDGNGGNGQKTPATTAAALAKVGTAASTIEPSATETPTETLTPTITDTPTDTPTATETPTATIPPETQVWLDLAASQAALGQFASATAAPFTYTPSYTPTPTATPTATPNYTATYEAYMAAAVQTLTATHWTATPTSTPTATDTPTPTDTPTNTPTPSPIPAGSAVNWQPVVREIGKIPMVEIPAGCFMMGSDDGEKREKPVHRVCLSAFWIGQTEVTNAQYRRCVEAEACDPPKSTTYYADSAYAGHPVVYVAWSQAQQYANWLSETTGLAWSLPTEAQWEYAARGPESRKYPWGSSEPTCTQANISGCEGDTAPVGPDQRAAGASWIGALDMAGNAWEWTADWYDENYYSTLADEVWDPVGPASGGYRVVRGGSWFFDQGIARCAVRANWDPLEGTDGLGFRVVVASPGS